LYPPSLDDIDDAIDATWWTNSAIWRVRETADTVERPCEDEALRNIYYEARAMSGSLRSILNPLEQIVYEYDLECKRKAPFAVTTKERIAWILETMQRRRIGLHLSFWQVSDILDEIDYVKRNMSMLEHFEEQRSYKQAQVDALNELKLEALLDAVDNAA
jgi:hypothetical protein